MSDWSTHDDLFETFTPVKLENSSAQDNSLLPERPLCLGGVVVSTPQLILSLNLGIDNNVEYVEQCRPRTA
jgi:hypothetical protein